MSHLNFDAINRIEEVILSSSLATEQRVAEQSGVDEKLVTGYLSLRRNVENELRNGNQHPKGIAQRLNSKRHLLIYDCIRRLTADASYIAMSEIGSTAVQQIVLPIELDRGEADLVEFHLRGQRNSGQRQLDVDALAETTLIHPERLRSYLEHRRWELKPGLTVDDTWVDVAVVEDYEIRSGGPVWSTDEVYVDDDAPIELQDEDCIELPEPMKRKWSLVAAVAALAVFLVWSCLLICF